jgi:ceramide glucosyltransferase
VNSVLPFLVTASLSAHSLYGLFAQACAVFTTLFCLTAIAASYRLFRRRPEGPLPPVTLMKPLKGHDRELYDNLASFCAQDYPELQVIFCVADAQDPALHVVDALKADFPELDIETVVSGRKTGCNPKISNLANGYSKVKHDLLMISDSDIRVRPDFLRRAVAPMADPKMGLVTCFYRALDTRGLWGKLEALAINAYFLPQAALAAGFGMKFAMGAAMLVRRSVFDEIGGFEHLADHIADDYSLGQAVQRAGHGVGYADTAVDLLPEDWGAGDLIRHQIRESRTIRICQPGGYLGTIVLSGPALLAIHMGLSGSTPLSLALAFAGLGARAAATQALLLRASGRGMPLSQLFLLPIAEILHLFYWVSGFSASQVLWRGEIYSIEPNGRLVPVAE